MKTHDNPPKLAKKGLVVAMACAFVAGSALAQFGETSTTGMRIVDHAAWGGDGRQ